MSATNKKRPVPRGFRKDAETMTQYQLSVKYSASKHTVKRWIDKLGIDRGYARWTDEEDETLRKLHFEQGLSLAEIGRRMNRPPSTVSKHVSAVRVGAVRGKPWSAEELVALREMAEAGFTIEDIAKELKRGESSIRHMADKRKLTIARNPSESGTLCWRCKNAVPNPATGAGCDWSRSFKPVSGWDAEERPLKNPDCGAVQSFFVKSCPNFDAEEKRGGIS